MHHPARSLLVLVCTATVGVGACGYRAPNQNSTPGIETYPDARDLHRLAETYRRKYQLPAVGVGVIHNGRIVGLGMAGERTAGSGDLAAIDDLFDVASCAKSITATIAAILVEEGAVRWDATVLEAFPEFASSIDAGYASTTLELLLRHRGGLSHEMNRNVLWEGWHRRHAGASPSEQRFQFARAALTRPPVYRPGADGLYTSDGYLVAGSMLERAAGVSWEELVRQRLFEPLGLESMQFGSGDEGGTRSEVSGHMPDWLGRPRATARAAFDYGDPPFGSPAGFLYASVPDLLRYLDAHIQGGRGRIPLLPRTAFERLHTSPDADPHALGWVSEVRRDASGGVVERSVFHGGYSGDSRANLWFAPVPDTGWGTVIVVNDGRGDDESITRDVFYGLLEEFGLVTAPR